MIRYLELRNWLAFNKVALHLSEGTTFVVAENGIGKTSLLRGAAWTLFAPRQVDPRLELRQGDGAGETAGLVVMSTAEGDLEIERTYRVGGRPANTLRATLAGVAIDPDHLDATLDLIEHRDLLFPPRIRRCSRTLGNSCAVSPALSNCNQCEASCSKHNDDTTRQPGNSPRLRRSRRRPATSW